MKNNEDSSLCAVWYNSASKRCCFEQFDIEKIPYGNSGSFRYRFYETHRGFLIIDSKNLNKALVMDGNAVVFCLAGEKYIKEAQSKLCEMIIQKIEKLTNELTRLKNIKENILKDPPVLKIIVDKK